MKWFKHISDSLDDPFIFELLSRFGSDGYLVFFGVLEIYSREFKTELDWKLCITRDYLRQKLCKRQDTLIINSLKHIQNSGKWKVEFINDKVIIFIPKFTELLDDWSQRKLRSNSVVKPEILKLNKNKIKEADKEEDNSKSPDGVFILPSWIPEETWKAYIAVRNKKKAANTTYALNLIIKKLEKFKPKHIEILNQSITGGWVDMYPLKGELNATGNNTGFKANSYRVNNNNRELDPKVADECDKITAKYFPSEKATNGNS